MYTRIACACVMAGVMLISARPGAVHAQKKDDNGPKTTQGTPAEYASLLQMREVVGKLSNTSGKSLTFDIEYLTAGGGGNNNINFNQGGNQQNYQQQMARLMQQQQQAMRAQNPQQRQQKMRQIAIQMQKMQSQQMYNTPKGGGQNPNANRAYKEFEVDLSDAVVVRRNFVPFEYDSKGYPKTYTKDELAALRGKDSSKPGYTAKFDDLQGGQIVKLYLSNPKNQPEKKDAKKDAKKPADDDGVGNVTKPVVTMILILADSVGTSTPNVPPKKKN